MGFALRYDETAQDFVPDPWLPSYDIGLSTPGTVTEDGQTSETLWARSRDTRLAVDWSIGLAQRNAAGSAWSEVDLVVTLDRDRQLDEADYGGPTFSYSRRGFADAYRENLEEVGAAIRWDSLHPVRPKLSVRWDGSVRGSVGSPIDETGTEVIVGEPNSEDAYSTYYYGYGYGYGYSDVTDPEALTLERTETIVERERYDATVDLHAALHVDLDHTRIRVGLGATGSGYWSSLEAEVTDTSAAGEPPQPPDEEHAWVHVSGRVPLAVEATVHPRLDLRVGAEIAVVGWHDYDASHAVSGWDDEKDHEWSVDTRLAASSGLRYRATPHLILDAGADVASYTGSSGTDDPADDEPPSLAAPPATFGADGVLYRMVVGGTLRF